MRPTPYQLGVGFVTNFLDALGIGSYATTTAAYKARNTVADEQIPGTLNVGHALPTIVEAAIYIKIIQVDQLTLWSLIATSVVGAWLGAGVVSRWSRRRVQRGMAIALILTGLFIALRQLHLFPPGGDALGLSGPRLGIALAANCVFGALMTLGVGLYAPLMGTVSLLGMSPAAAFPIMMGSCAFLMPVAAARFIRAHAYDRRAALGLSIGGVPAILLAAWLVRSLPLDAVRWLVVAIVLYTAVTMWRSSLRGVEQTGGKKTGGELTGGKETGGIQTGTA
jgi:uncharacterized membrane protein YfcA